MNESQLQSEHLAGHVLPGIAYTLLAPVLFYVGVYGDPVLFKFPKRCLREPNKTIPPNFTLISFTGSVLIIIAGICFCLWMADLGAGKNNTKIHRILSMMVLPLGLSMLAPEYHSVRVNKLETKMALDKSGLEILRKELLNKDQKKAQEHYHSIEEIQDKNYNLKHELYNEVDTSRYYPTSACFWRDFLPVYCLLNALIYNGHRHLGPDGDMNMPTGEEEGHAPLMWSFLIATVTFGLSQYLAIMREQTILYVVGCGWILIVGIWYFVLAGVLYGGAFGVNGINYGDATADFGIVVFVIHTVFILIWMIFHHCFRRSEIKKKASSIQSSWLFGGTVDELNEYDSEKYNFHDYNKAL